jgi:HEAT repeat protein
MRARLIVVSAALVLAASPALAQPKGGQPAKPPSAPAAAVDTKSIVDKVKSSDAARVGEGLAAAQAAGAAAAPVAPAIGQLLERGATAPIAKAAIDALGAIGAVSSSAVLRPYVKHRTPELRRAAARALSGTKGVDAIAAFREGLRSDDAMVRGFSAVGLGNLGATDALPDLFLALDRNVTEAAAAIGQLCAPADCDRFAGKLGRIGFEVMTSGFDPILFRQKPLPEEALLKIVGRLRELGTAEAGKYLADVAARWPATGSKKVKQAIDTAIPSIPGGGK